MNYISTDDRDNIDTENKGMSKEKYDNPKKLTQCCSLYQNNCIMKNGKS
jgi:hypothetical protein